MEKAKYKMLLLSDLNSTTDRVLENTVRLANVINGQIELLHVIKPSDVVDVDNQLSAMRAINSEHTVADNKISELIAPISKKYGTEIKYSFVLGNVRNEIANHIEIYSPDMIVLGRRKSKPLNFIGDGITAFVLNIFDGAVMILSKKHILKSEKLLSLGVINEYTQFFDVEFAQDLMKQVQEPIVSFKFIKNTNVLKEKKIPEKGKVVEYVFDYTNQAIGNLPKYLAKNNIDMLYMDRREKNSKNEMGLLGSDFKSVMNKAKVSLLISPR